MCCGPWGHKEADTTDRLNRTESYKHRGKAVSTIHEVTDKARAGHPEIPRLETGGLATRPRKWSGCFRKDGVCLEGLASLPLPHRPSLKDITLSFISNSL